MVRTLTGDLFASTAQTLVNTVNCVGVMGKGIALEFKKRFPDMYADYVKRCAAKQVRLGQPYLFRSLMPLWILNFPTKDDWRSVSRMSDIVAGLKYLEQHYHEWGITSLAVPPLGCGQGQLEWRVVGPTLFRYLCRLDIPVELYAPYGTPEHELATGFLSGGANASANGPSTAIEEPKINPAWIALIEIVARIEREPYHWPVGRTTFQKIAYFATEEGLPTKLRYARGSYGPFSPDVKSMITRLVNHSLIQEHKLGRMLSVKPGPTYKDAVKEYQTELQDWEQVIERITDLFLRMTTQHAETAATVHFAAQWLEQTRGSKPSETDVMAEVKRWKQKRRPPLRDEDIARTVRNLNILRWLAVRPSADLPVSEETFLDA
ncbi:MAG: type II toxin-antitoxin system antitoxin DNA ADP-ribosyl glycohydrolase DarG [Candidatus Binatia bacterium]